MKQERLIQISMNSSKDKLAGFNPWDDFIRELCEETIERPSDLNLSYLGGGKGKDEEKLEAEIKLRFSAHVAILLQLLNRVSPNVKN